MSGSCANSVAEWCSRHCCGSRLSPCVIEMRRDVRLCGGRSRGAERHSFHIVGLEALVPITRFGRLAIIVGTAGLGIAAWSPSAHAASQSATPNCSSPEQTTNVFLDVGDTFTINIEAPGVCGYFLRVSGGLANTGTVTFGPNGTETPVTSTSSPPVQEGWRVNIGDEIIFTATSVGGLQINVWPMSGATGSQSNRQSYRLNVSSGGGGASSSGSTAASLPAPIVQQFARPVSGTCLAAAPTSLNWSGVSSGGWGESWAQWPNGGAGGPVCTRTLTYSASQSAWVTS